MPKNKLRWKRILLKLSGETLGQKGKNGIDIDAIEYIAQEIKSAYALGCEIAIVMGGGNFIRGANLAKIGIDRASADYMGMLATVINALALQNVLEEKGLFTRVMSSLTMIEVAEPFIRRRALRHLEKRRIVIFAAGTGSPYFTTDTTAALRASEINAQIILKATNVEGVFEQDPKQNSKAKLLSKITPLEMVKRGLKIMDLTAVTLAMENKTPVVVFNVFKKGNLRRLLEGENIGSQIVMQ